MKFINYLEKTSGVSIYGMSSLILFTTIFTVMLVWALRADKKMIREISEMPLKLVLLIVGGLLISTTTRAEGPKPPDSIWNPFVLVMIGLIVLLLIVIKALSNLLLTSARQTLAKEKTAAKAEARTDHPAPVKAGGAVPVIASASVPLVNGISDMGFYFLITVVGIELLVILYLLYNLNVLLQEQTAAAAAAAKPGAEIRPARPAFNFQQWWSKVNRFRPIEQEVDLDLGHDYDGIRELNNRLPPWWIYGFYCTMIFAVIYLWRYHVSHTAPLQAQEYEIAVAQAEVEKAEYLKTAANNVDETTVKQLTSAADLEAGKEVFQTICFACHGKNGEGGVGPNLTDAYWLHGGTIQDIFKTIKYGWPDKGMKSWKDDYSPSQIAQIASYVKSLGGTNPPNPKAPQGDLVKQ